MIWRRRPAPILGHIFAGDAMRLDYAQQQALTFICCCFCVGGVFGFITALVRGERHG